MKKERKNKPRNPKKVLWRVFSEYVRRKEGGKCISCGDVKDFKYQQAGHYIPKSVCGMSLYFDERNVHCQCVRCNKWLHGNLTAYAVALEGMYGDGILQQLEFEKGQIVKNFDYEGKILEYKEKLKEFTSAKE